MLDTQFPQRIACCILNSAVDILGENGIGEPDRVEYIQHRPDVFPGCCSALLLRDTRTANVTPADNNCGIHEVEITWDLQYTDCMTIRDPKAPAEAKGLESGDCRDILRCPGEEHQFENTSCDARTKAEETDYVSTARWALTGLLASRVKSCLCSPDSAPFPDDCAPNCMSSTACQYVRLQDVTAVDGGGCYGFRYRLQTRHFVA